MTPRPTPIDGILLVEDDRDIRETVAEALADEGYRVEVAANGREALERLNGRETLPFVVLLDLMMPIKDGWSFWAELRANPRWARLPVVVISADANVKEKVAPLGPMAALRKPIRFDDLLSIVARCRSTQANGQP